MDLGYGKRWSLFWDFVVSGWQVMRGVMALSRFKEPIVTIFGGTCAQKDNEYVQKSSQLARMLAENKFAVISGGGPGIMLAAMCGASSVQGKTLGIGVYGVDEEFQNPCAPLIKVDHFFVRKWLLMRYSVGFVIFPGGVGTADELFGLLNEMRVKFMRRVPIILVGKSYWQPLLHWLSDHALKQGFVAHEDLHLLTVTDDLQHAVRLIQEHVEKLKEDVKKG